MDSRTSVISQAIERPNGAHFYKCALQVNPYDYGRRHAKQTQFTSEESYNKAIVSELVDQGISVIGITDHYRVRHSNSLAEAAKAAGIIVFMGFEAVSKDGVHVLCLFDPSEDVSRIERFLGECGVHDDSELSPVGDKDFDELITACNEKWNGVCIAAHVCSKGGLLKTLSGQTAIKAWTHPYLYACSLAGPVSDAPDNHRPIIENRNSDYTRERPIAVLTAQDLSKPEDASSTSVSSWIKMASVSVEGLRQSFLDPESRIRLITDQAPEEHTELRAICWEGGFLDGIRIHFNSNLNVLIGGRGTGKSTIVESIRFVLGLPVLGKDAQKQHNEFVNQVLGPGSKVSLALRSHRPSLSEYQIERTFGNAPLVIDNHGNLTDLHPKDIASGIEIFGQHEISEIARSPERLTSLLDRFRESSANMDTELNTTKHSLEDTRTQILDIRKSLERIDADLAKLPALKETLKRYRALGLDERLKDKKQLVREKAILETIDTNINNVSKSQDALTKQWPIDTSQVEELGLKDLGGKDILSNIKPVIVTFNEALDKALRDIKDASTKATQGLSGIRKQWEEREQAVNKDHEKILRELKKEGIDGNEYTTLLEQIEDLKPKKEEKRKQEERLRNLLKQRREALTQWEDLKAVEFRALERGAKKVTRRLSDRVQVKVSANADRRELNEHIKSLGGRTAEILTVLASFSPLPLQALAQACREGKESLIRDYGFTAAQADKLANSGEEFFMKLEELNLPATTSIQLNIAREGATPNWKELSKLSSGQKATAVLLLLLLDSDAPLVVDQPEDDLDNRFITEGIVPKVKEEKQNRQFIFATHNANIPVLGDAELIVALVPAEDSSSGEVHLPDRNLGSIDSKPVRELVEETLEGGRTAFEMRRLKYGF